MATISISDDGMSFLLTSKKPLANKVLRELGQFTLDKNSNDENVYTFDKYANVAFVLDALLMKYSKFFQCSDEVKKEIANKKQAAEKTRLFIYDDNHLGITCPGLPFYRLVMQKISAYERSYTCYTIPFSRAFDTMRLLKSLNTFLPAFVPDDDVKEQLLTCPESFDGTLPSLYSGDIGDLYTVKKAYKVPVENFKNVGYEHLSDFLLKRPRRYIDKTKANNNEVWHYNDDVTILGTIEDFEVIKGQHLLYKISLAGSHKLVKCIFYRRIWMQNKFHNGDEVLIMGKAGRRGEITGGSMDSLIEATALPIVPIYPQSAKNKITTKIIMNSIYELLARLGPYTKDIAEYINQAGTKMNLQQAIQSLHFPKDINDYKLALNTLAFYELVYMQLMIINRKNTEVKKKGISKPMKKNGIVSAAIKGLPFTLTKGQQAALQNLGTQLGSDSAEQALLNADVGAGKSVVAQLLCLQAVDNGCQAVLAGPTEVLAKQLYSTFEKLISTVPASIRPSIVYLSGQTKTAEKRQILQAIKFGDVDLIVGTHSVLNANIPYHNLGFICIDEQQKFGANQRTSLLNSRDDDKVPDLLVQTATPIPRSTAQVFYGDINLVTIDEKPKGRKEILTKWVHEAPRDLLSDKKSKIWKDIIAEKDAGHKTFIVVPMVYESDKTDAASVQETVKALKKLLPDINIEYVHGQMKKESQLKHMQSFKKGKAQILVASTVIEVGVDVPEATRMLILSADRLGASSLHQIRGRIGRNSLDSICYLVSDNEHEASKARLEALENSNNGFEIATVDLKTRGEGDLFGTQQSGENNLKFANLIDYSKMINKAKEIAGKIYFSPRRAEALSDARAVLDMNDKEE